MASNGNRRGKLLTAGGTLSIVAGVFEVIGGVLMLVTVGLAVLFGAMIGPLWRYQLPPIPFWLMIIIGLVLVALGGYAIIGGISAMRRKRFGVSLVGAMCSIPSVPLGVLAIIFVALGKREFGAERKENGI